MIKITPVNNFILVREINIEEEKVGQGILDAPVSNEIKFGEIVEASSEVPEKYKKGVKIIFYNGKGQRQAVNGEYLLWLSLNPYRDDVIAIWEDEG